MSIKIISEDTLRQHIHLTPDALHAVEQAYSKLAQNKVVMPPVMHLNLDDSKGEVDIKAAYIKGLDKFAIKQSSGFFHNPEKGLPSSSGLMIVIDAQTGFPCALLLDNGYLTDVRTALAGAIAANYLAPQKIETVGVIGAGNQARYQTKALQLVRDFKHVVVYARNSEKAKHYAEEMEKTLGCPVTVANSVHDAAQQSQILVTTTPTTEPLLMEKDLHPGLHITAMGSDAASKNEIHPSVFNTVHRIVCDSIDQCLTLGECHHAQEHGTLEPNRHKVTTLGQVILGQTPGRQSESDITLCDLTGTGAQDTAIAKFALDMLGY